MRAPPLNVRLLPISTAAKRQVLTVARFHNLFIILDAQGHLLCVVLYQGGEFQVSMAGAQ